MTEARAATTRRRMPAADRRKLILDVARSAFLDSGEGPNGASVRLIAERSGINEALIYRHFGNKENLYFEAVTAQVHAVIEGLVERALNWAAVEEPVARERREWELTFGFVQDLLVLPPDVLRAAGMLLLGDRDYAERFYQRSLAPAIRAIEELVSSELSNWEHADFSPALAVRTTLATAVWQVMGANLTRSELDPVAEARALTDLIFYGIARPKPPSAGSAREG